MKQNFRSTILIALVFSLAAVPAMAQTERTLELQTDDGQIDVPLEDGVPLRILSNGDISATAQAGFSCPTGGASCDDVQVSLNSNGGSFTLSPTTVTQGSNVSIQWNGAGAWECQGSGLPGTSWNSVNPKQPSGSQNVGTSALTAGNSYQVEVTCSNGPVTDSRIRTLTVQEDTIPDPEGCEDVAELSDFPDWAEATDALYGSGVVNPSTWSAVFGDSFPEGGTFHLQLTKGEYAAMRFTTPANLNSLSAGSINSEISSTSSQSGAGPRMISITTCPGVFDPQEISDSDCLAANVGSGESFKWTGPGHQFAFFQCELQPNTTYYLNMLFSDSDAGTLPPEQATCRRTSDTACSLILEPRDNNL